MDATDRELLNQFVRERSEDAFHELVRRHLPMVLATSRRIVGDAQLAEEAAQDVFILLTRKCPELDSIQAIAGWIYQTTRRCALNLRRSEYRRQQREQTAALMHADQSEPPRELLSTELEHALSDLSTDDRDALVIRFLEDRSLREVSRELGVGEDAARKRVSRALERLREVFVRRGVTASAAAITALLAGEATAASTALVASITKTAVASPAIAVGGGATLIQQGTLTTMKAIHAKLAATAVAAALITGTSVHLAQQRGLDRLKTELRAREALREKLDTSRREQAATIQLRDQQIEQLRMDTADLHRLRAEVDRLNRELAEKSRLVTQLEQGRATAAPTSRDAEPAEPADEDWKQAAARIRAKMFGLGGDPTAEEMEWLRDAKPKIEQLERDPTQFAGFQSELIKTIVPSVDATRLRQISDVIRQTYEAAVAQGLDLPSKPATDTADWVNRRFALDRAGTGAVQALLSPSELEQFDRRFLGVMGVDLGTGVDQSNYPPGFLGGPPPSDR